MSTVLPRPPLGTALAGTARLALVGTASRLAYLFYLLRRTLRRRLWAWPSAPRPGDDVLHLRWLNAALTAAGLQGAGSAVVGATPAALAVNRGMVGTIVRINLTYNGVGTPGPASLILKVRGSPECAVRVCCFQKKRTEKDAVLCLLPAMAL